MISILGTTPLRFVSFAMGYGFRLILMNTSVSRVTASLATSACTPSTERRSSMGTSNTLPVPADEVSTQQVTNPDSVAGRDLFGVSVNSVTFTVGISDANEIGILQVTVSTFEDDGIQIFKFEVPIDLVPAQKVWSWVGEMQYSKKCFPELLRIRLGAGWDSALSAATKHRILSGYSRHSQVKVYREQNGTGLARSESESRYASLAGNWQT